MSSSKRYGGRSEPIATVRNQDHLANEPKGYVQAGLSVSSAGESHEAEANAMADLAMRMPSQNFVQRKCADCEKEEDKKHVQRKEAPGGGVQASESVSHSIQSSKGGGSGMDNNTRSFMETRFGADFGNVKIHTNGEAVQMSRDLNARAFTVGNDVYFNQGEYQPGSEKGKHLLAHELAHTIQQNSGGVQRQVQRWKIAGNTATCDTEGDTLGRLAEKAGGHFDDWKCIKPLSMKTALMTKRPTNFDTEYFKYVQADDTFDISNITETGGRSINLHLFDDSTEKQEADAAKLFYRGATSSTDVDLDIDISGSSPIGSLVMMGHQSGGAMFGGASRFTPSANESESPTPRHSLASMGLFPRRCWFTRNATVRSVGCDSEDFGNDFAKVYLRNGANIITTTKSIRLRCSNQYYIPQTNQCVLRDGIDFAASPAASARTLQGPFWDTPSFHAGRYWKSIGGKL